jgi:hypothetical protein
MFIFPDERLALILGGLKALRCEFGFASAAAAALFCSRIHFIIFLDDHEMIMYARAKCSNKHAHQSQKDISQGCCWWW